MYRKLAVGVAALTINLGGLALLAAPAAATTLYPCTDGQAVFAAGYAAGSCGGNAQLLSCNGNSNGTITITYRCFY
jgi:hypothetical protein